MANERIIDFPDLGRDPQSGDVFALDTYGGTTKKIDFEDLRDAMLPVYGQKTITANGTYPARDDGVDAWSSVTANVPNTYTASDEGKVVDNGMLTAQTSLGITENGTYNTTTRNLVTVNVAAGGADLAGNLAPAYESLSFPVSEGTGCMYNGLYYVANQSIQTAETFDPNKWSRNTASEQIYWNEQDIAALQDDTQNICVRGSTTNLSVGVTTITAPMITGDHVVVDWGFNFGDNNNPPAQIYISTYDGSYTINVTDIYFTTGTVTITPTFVKQQN